MALDITKDVTIGETRYSISKLPVKTAMWLAMQVFTKVLPGGVGSQLGLPDMGADRPQMNEREFSEIINYCLVPCKRYEMVGAQEVAMPIMNNKGVWLAPELEYDPEVMIGLLVYMLEYNISAFFNERVLKNLSKTFKGVTLFGTQP